ncbi:phosphoglycerate kinase [Pedobacter sp.]|nr:phosphoglycerate kinase [Candidatus Saccharibacteria bacterium]
MIAFLKKTLKDIPIDGKTILVRADYNVPLTEDGQISDDYRIVSSLPTLQYLIDRGCRIVVCSHLGRPDGKVTKKESLEPIALHLGGLLHQSVSFVPECIGDQVVQAVKKLQPGRILLLENVRFHAGEETNDEVFAQQLAHDSGAAYFIQDGFGVVHRAHASTAAITHYLPSVAGLLLEKECRAIIAVTTDPVRPMVAILGGAKISDKIGVIERFVEAADMVVIGGAMANTFLKYRGYEIGKSLCEDGLDAIIEKIYKAAAKKTESVDDFIILPRDVAVATSLKNDDRRVVVDVKDVKLDEYILDVGSESIHKIVESIEEAKTVVWNGTLGMAERKNFSYGSARTALALAKNPHITSVVGGGDTVDFVLKWDSKKGKSFSHVSTGGGAGLELMAGQPMPGVDALLDA